MTVGEYCHDANSNGNQRAPAGTCEWNLIKQPGFHGWPFCVGDNSAINTSWRWNYAAGSTTGSQYNCSLSSLPSDINYAPTGQTAAPPTYQGLENIPGPAVPATIWKKYAGAAGGQSTADFGDLSAGGMQPITGPVYRYDEETAGPGAFPPYYDGSWLINNRGSDNGFWKEVRLREADNNMLHVHDWLPYNAAGTDNGSFNSLVIGTQFGPDGALYMSRFPVGCCRNNIGTQQVQIVKIEFNVADQCEADTQPPNAAHELTGQAYPGQPNTYVNSVSLRLTATDVGCAGTDTIEYRLDGAPDWQPYGGPVTFDEAGDYSVEYRATDRMDNTSAVAHRDVHRARDRRRAGADGHRVADRLAGPARLLRRQRDADAGRRRRADRLRRAADRVPPFRRRLAGVQHARHVRRPGRLRHRVPRYRQRREHLRAADALVPGPLRRGLCDDAVGRVRRLGARRALELRASDDGAAAAERGRRSAPAAAGCLLGRPGASGPDRVRRPAAAGRRLRADHQDLGARAGCRRGRSGQRVRPGGPEDLPGRQRLDQDRPHPKRRRQPDRLGQHLLRDLVRRRRNADAGHARGERPTSTCRRGGCGWCATARR